MYQKKKRIIMKMTYLETKELFESGSLNEKQKCKLLLKYIDSQPALTKFLPKVDGKNRIRTLAIDSVEGTTYNITNERARLEFILDPNTKRCTYTFPIIESSLEGLSLRQITDVIVELLNYRMIIRTRRNQESNG